MYCGCTSYRCVEFANIGRQNVCLKVLRLILCNICQNSHVPKDVRWVHQKGFDGEWNIFSTEKYEKNRKMKHFLKIIL